MFSLRQPLWRFNLPALLALITLLAFSGLRAVLLLCNFEQTTFYLPDYAGLFLRGIVFDAVVAGYVYGFFSLVGLLLTERFRHSRYGQWLRWAVVVIYLYLLCFVLVAESLFWQEFNTRFNFIAVDYLIYSREVSENIKESYPIIAIMSALALVALLMSFLLRHYIRASTQPQTYKKRLLAAFMASCIMLMGSLLRGDDVPQLSQNMYIEELAHNGVFQFFYAYRHNHLEYDKFYRLIEPQKASRLLKENVVLAHEALLNPHTLFDVTRQITATAPERRLNVVLIAVESLSADYLTHFGSQENITPHLDKLAQESLFFTQYYATGNRTVRGLEALTLGIPPTAGSAVVRRPNNHDLFSLASVLNKKGYDSKFIYGGYGYFDNMNVFFANNGYQIVDRADFNDDEQGFANVWGVADEYLYLRTLREADKSYAANKPFFSLVLTTSNHRPYTFPQGRIDAPQKKWSSAVKYTDWAIAHFLQQAKQKPWFDNTLFVISADHCAGSAGKTAVPVERYHIPLLIYAPKHIAPRQMTQLISQIDVPPTILGLLNMSYVSRFYGRDVFRVPDGQQRALVATYQRLGLYQKNQLVILSPQRKVEWHNDPLGKNTLLQNTVHQPIVDEAISYYQGADYALRHGLLKAIK